MDYKDIVNKAIDLYNPSHIICLYLGGYDSLVSSYLVNKESWGLPVLTYSIDTQLSADGWRDYICGVASDMKWQHDIYDNKSGFLEYVQWVKKNGQPYSPLGHQRAYARLKDRAIDAMLRDHKTNRFDKVLFISGIRKYESTQRQKLKDPIQRKGSKKSPGNAIFANPLFYWHDNEVLSFRLDYDLPDNPFYETVGGSGDCQCNWGKFITYLKLLKESPNLASGNVKIINDTSNQYHGYGWDGKPEAQTEMFQDFVDEGEMTSPFLCQNCSRSKSPRPGLQEAEQMRLLNEWA